jgi:protein O-mannosyl-transferase
VQAGKLPLKQHGELLRKAAKPVLATLMLLGLTTFTYEAAQLWGNTHDQAIIWAALNPNSPRAQANAAISDRMAGRPDYAIARLRTLLKKEPDQVQLAFNLFSAECQLGYVEPATVDAAETALRTTRDTGNLLVHWFEQGMAPSGTPPCPQLDNATIARLLRAAEANGNFLLNVGRRQDIYYLEGRLALMQHRPEIALEKFNAALDLRADPSIALEQAAILGSMGYPRYGLAHLDHYEAMKAHIPPPAFGMPLIHAWILASQQYWPTETAHLRKSLVEDALHQPNVAK